MRYGAVMDEFDVAISQRTNGKAPQAFVLFPMGLSRPLLDRGYNRAVIRVTDEGLLVVPYTAERAGRGGVAELPESWQ